MYAVIKSARPDLRRAGRDDIMPVQQIRPQFFEPCGFEDKVENTGMFPDRTAVNDGRPAGDADAASIRVVVSAPQQYQQEVDHERHDGNALGEAYPARQCLLAVERVRLGKTVR